MSSNAQRTMQRLRANGYECVFTQYWNSFSKRSSDLLGFVDVLAFNSETLAVQSTSWSNISARVKKIKESEKYLWAKKAGWKIQVEGWGQKKNRRWVSKIVDL